MEKLLSYIQNHYFFYVKEDVEVYCTRQPVQSFWKILDALLLKRAMTRRELSSMMKNRNTIYNIYHEDKYVPSKRLCICIGICLCLNRDEFDDFLHDSGYHLSNHIKSDVVVMFCIENEIYSLERLDLYLEKVGEKPLYSCYF